MNNTNSTIKTGGVPDSPLFFFQPFNIIVFLSFFSPVILAISITSMSFIFQNFKGFIYLGFLIGCCVVRSYIYAMSGSLPSVSDNTICTSIQYSKYGNPNFSSFVFVFTIVYISIPMFFNGSPNLWVFFSLILYFLLDMFIKIYKKCTIKMEDLFFNILFGMVTATMIVILMYSGGSGKYLFFNEISSNNEICYQPSKQTFKCNLYRNGELISGHETNSDFRQ